MQQTVSFLFEIDNKNLIIIVLTLLALLTLSASLIKKYRQRMFSNFTDAIPQMDDTLLDFSGHWKDGEWATDLQTIEEVNQQIQNTEAKTVK